MTVTARRRQQRGMAISQGGWGGWISDPSVIPPNSAYAHTSAGVVVNERSVVSLMAVAACIRVLGDAAASLQPHVYRRTGPGAPRMEVDPPDVICDPYADISERDGAFRQVASWGLGGNVYRHVIDRDARNLPVLTELLNPGMVKVEMIEGQKCYSVGGKPIPAGDLVHVPWMALPGGLVGLNPIEIGSVGLGIAIASEEYAARYFAQGMHPAGILSIEKPLRSDDLERVQQELFTKHGGLAQSHTPIVLDAATKWQQISMTPETSQLLQSRAFSREEIAGFFGVPMYALGDVSDRGGTYMKGIQELLIGFATFGLSGYAARLDEVDNALLPPGYYAKRKVSDLFKTNDQMLALLIQAIRMASVATPNELRPWLDLPPSTEPGADSLFAPLNSAQSDWMQPEDAPTPLAAAIKVGAAAPDDATPADGGES